jgi:hypothetical protein
VYLWHITWLSKATRWIPKSVGRRCSRSWESSWPRRLSFFTELRSLITYVAERWTINLSDSLTDLISELEHPQDQLLFLLDFFVLYHIVYLDRYPLDNVISSYFLNDVTLFLTIAKPEGFPKKHLTLHLQDALLSFIFVTTYYKGLTSHPNILLCMYFSDIDSYITTHLKQCIFDICKINFFVKVLNIYS